mmetsp:Transcript_10830/g.16130  ORF Transcript_10830/g.16130 Transcript_10830/m.16130 type:complete len:342 (+) Transcript_10830:108-1133(+)
MPKQKKRSSGKNDKKRKDRHKNAQKRQAENRQQTPISPLPASLKPRELISQDHTSWMDEFCEIAAEANISPETSEKLLKIAAETGPRMYLEPTQRTGNMNSTRNNQTEASKARILDQKMRPLSTKTPRKKSLSDDFVGASLTGDMRRLVHLQCQVSIDSTNRKWGWTALMAAASNGHLKCVRYLVKCKACINAQEKAGWTALMLAARSGKFDVVEYLISAGADIKPRTRNHQTVYCLGDKFRIGAAIQRGLKAKRLRDNAVFSGKQTYTKPVIEWGEEDVCRWLRTVGCSEANDAFRENMINGQALLDINLQDLGSIGIGSEKLCKKVSREIDRLLANPYV